MRVGLDLTLTLAPRPSGTSLYARALTEALAGVAGLERVGCYRLSGLRRRAGALPGLPARFYWDALAPRLARELDLFHGLESRAAGFRPRRQVVTLHEVMHLWLPEFVRERGAEVRRARYAAIRERADLVLTPSASEREKVIEHLGLPPERVLAVPLAPAPSFAPRTEPDPAQLVRLGLEAPYVLFVGVAQPRKNVVRLAEAMARLPAEVELVLAGPVASAYQAELEAALAPLGPRARRLGYVANAELPGLFAGALCAAVPSTYESFGIPVLEAMACGCPVVCSEAGALPEVAGGAARLFDPASTEALAAALAGLVGSEAERTRLRQAGLRRAAEFSYARTARETAAAYARLA